MENPSFQQADGELPVLSEARVFARLLLPIYEMAYQRQLMAEEPCWSFLTLLERRMRELEEEAK